MHGCLNGSMAFFCFVMSKMMNALVALSGNKLMMTDRAGAITL
jgi:hypothetical protein